MFKNKVGINRITKPTKKNEGIITENIKPIIPSLFTKNIFCHSFSACYIFLTINMFIDTQAGFRGISKIYKEFQRYFEIQAVSFCCIRQWVLRLGYGLLNLEVEKRTDWIYILDFSIQLGKERCLLILGVTVENVLKYGYELKHQQVSVLDIFVQEHFDGQSVKNRLSIVKEKTGTPFQVISDNGNDVRKGVELFRQENNSVIDTYDITHMIGICIKHKLEKDERWINLQDDLRCLTQQTKQSDVSFLRPIALSKKARWLNIKNEITWLENIYAYEENSDFHLISKGIKIKNAEEIFEKNKANCINKYQQKHLEKDLKNTVFENRAEIDKLLIKYKISITENIETIDAGKARFDEKFAVLKKHKQYFLELKELNEMAENIKTIVKSKGLSMDTLQIIELEYNKINYTWVKQIFYDINNRLISEHSKCGIYSNPILCCSDIIESIFGKFKMKTNQTVGGIYETILSIVLFCSNLTEKLITEILTRVKMSDVENWFEQMAGVSNLAKRRIAFG